MEHFFLVGSVRSGTTMLRLMLDQHPKLGCFGEFEYVVDMLTDPGSPPSGIEFASWLSKERRFVSMGLKANASADYASIATGLLTQLEMASDKNLSASGMSVHRHFERLPFLWPNAKFVYLIRDGRDVSNSCRRMGWAGHLYQAADYWENAERSWERLQEHVCPVQCYEIRNESLVRHPVESLTKLCDFLGVEYDGSMLRYHENSAYGRPDPSKVAQWRHSMTPGELSILEARIGERLRRRGYAESGVPPVRLSFWRRLRYSLINRIGKHQFRIKRFGFWTWFVELGSRKLRIHRLEQSASRRIRSIALSHLK
ncbi:MAG: sulfotransferase [Planctomycetota bacterium]